MIQINTRFSLNLFRLSLYGMVYAVMLVFTTVISPAAFAEIALEPTQAANQAGWELSVKNATLLAVLDTLSKQTGMTIKGRQFIVDHPISGRYQGDFPELLKSLLQNEEYLLTLTSSTKAGRRRVESITFVDRADLKQIPLSPSSNDPVKKEERRVSRSISPSPPNTQEHEHFDATVDQLRQELEQSLSPLMELRTSP